MGTAIKKNRRWLKVLWPQLEHALLDDKLGNARVRYREIAARSGPRPKDQRMLLLNTVKLMERMFKAGKLDAAKLAWSWVQRMLPYDRVAPATVRFNKLLQDAQAHSAPTL